VEREDGDGVVNGMHADTDPERAGAPVGEAEYGREQEERYERRQVKMNHREKHRYQQDTFGETGMFYKVWK